MDSTLEAVLRFQHGQVTAPFKPVVAPVVRKPATQEDNSGKGKEQQKEREKS
jgi:hypothetical protein